MRNKDALRAPESEAGYPPCNMKKIGKTSNCLHLAVADLKESIAYKPAYSRELPATLTTYPRKNPQHRWSTLNSYDCLLGTSEPINRFRSAAAAEANSVTSEVNPLRRGLEANGDKFWTSAK